MLMTCKRGQRETEKMSKEKKCNSKKQIKNPIHKIWAGLKGQPKSYMHVRRCPISSETSLLNCCSEYLIFSSCMQDMISSCHFAWLGGKESFHPSSAARVESKRWGKGSMCCFALVCFSHSLRFLQTEHSVGLVLLWCLTSHVEAWTEPIHKN